METIIGSLVGVSFHTFDNIFDIFFTEERLIACNVKHHTDVPIKSASIFSQLIIPGLMAKRTEQMEQAKITSERRESLLDKTPEKLLSLHRSNFDIPYSEIITVEITRSLFQSLLKFHTSNPAPLRQKISFMISKEHIPDAQHLLEKVLENKIKRK